MIEELLKQGRTHLEGGHLVKAKEVCQQISAYLDYYIVSQEQWALVDGFLKEILLLQQLAQWKEKGRPEYEQLHKLMEAKVGEVGEHGAGLSPSTLKDLENLERFLH